MSDPRVESYREAAEAMCQGKFNLDIPLGDADEVSRLGLSLRDLAQSLEAKFEESAKLARITESANQGLVVDEVLDQVYGSFSTVIPYDRIGLALIESGGIVRSCWARSEADEIHLPVGFAAGLAGSSLEEIVRTGQPRIINDLEDYYRRHPHSHSTRRILAEGMRSSFTCPLVALEKPFGFLFFSSTEKDAYSEVHQSFFLQIASQLSVILEKGRLYQHLLDLNRELSETQEALAYQANHDSLTRVWNRGAVLKLLGREMARSQREGRPLSTVMIDIDHFKRINDSHGHLVGDEVLQAVTNRIASCLRAEEPLGRLGGEEFLAVLYPSDEGTARQVMERARSACFSTPIDTSAGDLEVAISLGAAVATHLDKVDMRTMLRAADRALYRAKEGGRNRAEIELIVEASRP